MKFTPTLKFNGGRLRPLEATDRDALFVVYQQPELPGQRPLEQPEQLDRMIELSVQMAATQRGMMWAIELGDDNSGYQLLGMASAYDWQPSLLKVALRIDGLPRLTMADRAAALTACINFMAEKYHLRSVAYAWIQGQSDAIPAMLESIGFQRSVVMRDGWRLGQDDYCDQTLYHHILPATTAEARL
ncbi:GNAT family N-acetyltransferase [Oceanobacter sp. 5_MG-2023]|uniref:GNAT family N-acetyltransferase n=1 Tax=Oceanobacter sp. 5_MG-2023 TaxID=3062645 RepID=UPI0026E13CCC|nr:GNAT family N-acetyltransferase [Oceanobacter sp. 5_MG-2023]MDO6681290.1 GNAT family N-acetyltransferase [Oceanobacter sp. 5_MG-2023]